MSTGKPLSLTLPKMKTVRAGFGSISWVNKNQFYSFENTLVEDELP